MSSLMRLEAAVIADARKALWALCAAPLAVSIRRCYHGLLLRSGRTRVIMRASFVRILVSIMLTFLFSRRISGALSGAVGLMAGAAIEACLLWMASTASLLKPSTQTYVSGLRKILGVHLPLAATALFGMRYLPLITTGIARLRMGTLPLAVWPILYGLFSLFMAPTGDFASITVSRAGTPEGRRHTVLFTAGVGLFFTACVALMTVTPLGAYYFRIAGPDAVEGAALFLSALFIGIPLPLCAVVREWLQGLLLFRQKAALISLAMVSSFVGTLLVFVFRPPGGSVLDMGAMAFTLTIAAEVVLLACFVCCRRRHRHAGSMQAY